MSKWIEKARAGQLRAERIGDYVIRVYADRIAIQRHSNEPISWEILQDIKKQVVGDVVAVEIFPIDSAVINLRNTRHLWFGPGVNSITEMCKHAEFEK